MESKKNNLTNPTEVIKEIFDDDHWIKDEFTKYFSSEIMQFSEAFSESFKRFPQLDKLCSGDSEQAAFVASFIFVIFDDLLVSMKLLIAGKMVASGNLMRQSIEGMAISILCSSSEPVKIKKDKLVNYWELVKSQDKQVKAGNSIGHLELDCDKLCVSRDAFNKFQSAQSHYHQFSHPGFIGMAFRMDRGKSGSIYIGGNFDTAKLSAYKIEIEERTGLCRILPNMIDGLISRLTI